MDNKGRNNRFPKLRFPGFEGEWEEKTLGEVATSFSGGTPKSGEPRFYGGYIPFIRSGEIHGDKTELFITEDGLNNSSAKLVKKGDLLFALYGATSGEVDLSKIEGAINQAILCIRSEVIDTCFLYNYLSFRKNHITGHFLQGGQGNLSSDIIMSLTIPFPPFVEQQKIASCLTEMDNTIAGQQQKVEALKAHKKGLMQQLFSQSGTISPRLRFPGFTGEWQEKPLSHFLHEHKTKSDGKCEVHSVSVTKGVINQVEYLGRSFAASDTSKYNLAKPGDIIYTKSPTGAFPYGIVKQNKNPYNVIVSPLYAVYTPLNQYVGYILDSYFESPVNTNNYLSSLIQKGAKNTIQISNDTFVSKSMCLPSNPAEQQKIAECLESLDSLIDSETKKLESLKTHKRGLMQQLFPQPNK